MAEPDYHFVTGRLVQGSVFEAQTKNMTGGPSLTLNGDPKITYYFAVAAPKTDAAMIATYQQIKQIAVTGFPGGETNRPDFAWKILDGDLPQYADKEGFPGHYVFKFSSGFNVSKYTKDGASVIVDPNQIKKGYYIRVPFTIAFNTSLKPGLFLNQALVELVGYGDEISAGPDASALLGGAGAATLPAGASATPVTSGPPLTPGVTVPPIAPGVTVPPVVTPIPPRPIQPAPDFLQPPAMTAKAAGATYQSFIDAGWTKEQLVAEGYVAP